MKYLKLFENANWTDTMFKEFVTKQDFLYEKAIEYLTLVGVEVNAIMCFNIISDDGCSITYQYIDEGITEEETYFLDEKEYEEFLYFLNDSEAYKRSKKTGLWDMEGGEE